MIRVEVHMHGNLRRFLPDGVSCMELDLPDGAKREVGITALEPVGNYALQPRFSDGHESGIFSWDYLYFLGSQQGELWQKYEERLAQAGAGRDDPMHKAGASGSACGHSH